MRPFDVAVAVAASQHGAISRRQGLDAGLTSGQVRALVRSGRWIRFTSGVYLVAGAPSTWKQRVMASVLAVDPAAAGSHLVAAYLHRFLDRPSPRIDVTCRYGRQDGARQGIAIVHRARTFEDQDVVLVEGIPVTCPARTLIDVAGLLPARQLGGVCDSALLAGAVTIDQIRTYANRRHLRHLRGVRRLFSLLADREEGIPESELERAFLALTAEFGLPAPTRQPPVGPYRVDFAYPDAGLIVELDGRAVHGTAEAFHGDRTRDNDLFVAGWTTILRFTWRHLSMDRVYVAETVEAILGRAGCVPQTPHHLHGRPPKVR